MAVLCQIDKDVVLFTKKNVRNQHNILTLKRGANTI